MAKLGAGGSRAFISATQCHTAAGGHKAHWDQQSQGWVLVTFHSCKINPPLEEVPASSFCSRCAAQAGQECQPP